MLWFLYFRFFFFHFCLFPGYSEVNSDTFWRVLRYRFYGTYSLPCPINAGIKAANSRYRRILLKFPLSLKDILALTKKREGILGLQARDKAAMLVFNTTEFFLKEFTLKMEFTSQRREIFLFLTTNMTVAMSRANQQWTKEREKGKINFAPCTV